MVLFNKVLQVERKMLLQKWKEVPLVSAALVTVNVIVFIICTFTGNLLYNMGELGVQNVVLQKEYARIIWSMFLHVDIHHLFNNMLILFFMGAMIEKEIGHIRYGIFYFLSGIGGNLVSLMIKSMKGEMACSIGASGAVFGLDGVLLALVLFSGRRMENVTTGRVLLMIAYSLYSGFTGDNIDNGAHIGGLLTGLLIGSLMCIIEKYREKQKREVQH